MTTPRYLYLSACSTACPANTSLVCPLIEHNRLSFRKVHLHAPVLTEGMQSIELGLEAASSLGDKDQVICKEQEQNHLPHQAWPINSSMQLCPLSCQVALKCIKI